MTKFALQAPGPQRRRYLAYVFQSEDGSRLGIRSPLNRAFFDAVVRYEECQAALYLEAACYRAKSANGTVAGIKNADRCAELVAEFTNGYRELDEWHAKENQFPALLRSIKPDNFLNPFGDDDHD